MSEPGVAFERARAVARATRRLHASPRVVLATMLATTWVVLSTWVVVHRENQLGGWSDTTDHASHWACAILIWHRGAEVYRRPLAEVCPEVPGGGCNIPERAGKRPLITNWRQFPRPYPPAWALWHAPAAVLHETTSISFATLNRLVVAQDLLAAHVAVYALATVLFLRRAAGPPLDAAASVLRRFVLALVGQELVKWAMAGFYDPIAIACAIVGIMRLADRRDVDAALGLSAALALHFRALWLSPALAFALVRAHRDGVLFARRTAGRLALAAVLLALAGSALVLVRDSLGGFPVTNPLFAMTWSAREPRVWNVLVPVAMAAAVLLHARAWLVAAVVAFQMFVLLRTPQSQAWHLSSFAPVFALACVMPGRHRGTEVAVAALFLVEAREVFATAPLPGEWLAKLFS